MKMAIGCRNRNLMIFLVNLRFFYFQSGCTHNCGTDWSSRY